MPDRLKLPPERDFGFWQRRKHDKWRAVEPPTLVAHGVRVAESHAHVHMLPDPAWELARCAANGVDFVCEICDPSEDALEPGAALPQWREGAAAYLRAQGAEGAASAAGPADATGPADAAGAADATGAASIQPPQVRFAAGVHPHNARLYDAVIEARLVAWLSDPACAALGEIGLDYHYDLSPRDTQRRVFRRQLALAKERGLPVSLHLRGGEDPVTDNAHAEALSILEEEGFPEKGTILHCCALPSAELQPWIDAGCHIAYGGALTFKNAEEARAGALLVPLERLLLETDSPYMTPEPMRGAACTPAHVIFTAQCLQALRGDDAISCAHDNAVALLGVSNADAPRG